LWRRTQCRHACVWLLGRYVPRYSQAMGNDTAFRIIVISAGVLTVLMAAALVAM
jgi:hypothetical protein